MIASIVFQHRAQTSDGVENPRKSKLLGDTQPSSVAGRMTVDNVDDYVDSEMPSNSKYKRAGAFSTSTFRARPFNADKFRLGNEKLQK